MSGNNNYTQKDESSLQLGLVNNDYGARKRSSNTFIDNAGSINFDNHDFVTEQKDDDDPLLARQKLTQELHAHSHVHHLSNKEKQLMFNYESLDYDLTQNHLYRAEHFGTDRRLNSRVNIVRWIIFAIIGMLTGSLAFVLWLCVDKLAEAKFNVIRDRVHNGEYWMAYFLFLLISVSFVTIATFLVAVVEPVSGGSGIPEIKGYLNGTNYLRFLRAKTLICKAVGVVFSVAGGLAIGKEGPLVHSGAIFAANVSHFTGLGSWLPRDSTLRKWILRFRNDKDKRDFVSGGAAAGVAAAFGAPVGGILFSLEEASSFWSIDLTWKCFLCSMLGSFFLNVWKIAYTGSQTFSGLISFGPPLTDQPYRLWETACFLLLALFGGIQGALFNQINQKICKWRRDVLAGRPIPRMLEAITVAVITATLCFWAPYIFDSCTSISEGSLADNAFLFRYNCAEGEYNSMATMIFSTWETSIRGFFHNDQPYSWTSLVAFFVIIFFLAVITYGIAVPSGLFVPCILMGCAYGRLLGEGMRWVYGNEIHPGTYAIIGATASLGGVARMTISLAVILVETTDSIAFVMPIMITLMVSKWVGDQFNISLYDLHVELKCMPFVESAPSGNMYHLAAKDIMAQPVITLTQTVRVRDIVTILTRCTHNGFPVVSDTEPHQFVGLILRNQLIVLLQRKAFGKGYIAKQMVSYGDFATSLQSKNKHFDPEKDISPIDYDCILDLRPFYNPVPITVQKGCPLSRVFVLFRSLGIRHLAVVNRNNEVVGVICRKEIMSSFDQDLF